MSRVLFVASLIGFAAFRPAVGEAAPRGDPRPVVESIEPPTWWVGHSMNPVRLLIRGRGLSGGRLETAAAGIALGKSAPNAAGTALFVDVTIAAEARPGPFRLRLVTPRGASEVDFTLEPPLSVNSRRPGLSPDDVLYLIMPDRFANGDRTNDDPPRSKGLLDRGKSRHYHGGDLRGIRERLPYLKDLGVTALWFNPIYDNTDQPVFKESFAGQPSTSYHGYHAQDFYAVEEHFGDLATLKDLVDAAHALGLKVVQDQVANHSGPYHSWLQSSPTPTWFNGTEASHLANNWQTWTLADPYSPPQVQKATLEGWFIDVLPDLNQDDPETARYIIQNALWWLGTVGFDGVRQDTLPYVPRRFWRDWRAAIKRAHPDVTVVGEMLEADPALVSFFQGGRERFDGIDSGIESLFDFPLAFALRRAFGEGRPLREVALVAAHDHLYVDPDRLVTLIGLHDLPRFMSLPGATHDGLHLAFTALFTLRGIPLVYYGDEIALPGGADPDNRRDFPGGWREDPRNAFEPGGRAADEQAIFTHVRRLAALRAELASLRRGRLVSLEVAEQAWAYGRVLDGEAVLVALNNGSRPAVLDFGIAPVGWRDGTVLIDRLGGLGELRVAGQRVQIDLPARSGALLVPRR